MQQIFVWRLEDVIGIVALALIGTLALIVWTADKIGKWRKRRHSANIPLSVPPHHSANSQKRNGTRGNGGNVAHGTSV